jgi:tetratricopeptide (TPR) repeat protein
MKNVRIFLLLVIVTFAGCDDSFLEVAPKTGLTEPIYFESQRDFEQAINGAYEPLRGLYNGTAGAWAMGELRSDNTTYKYNANDRGTIYPEEVADFIENSTNPLFDVKWSGNYRIISRVNQILDRIDGIEFDAAVKDNIKGQAYFLRAFAYFDLVQYFGEVPLHLKPAKTLDETALPLSPVDVIYTQMISDAQQAMELLPDKATQEKGRVTSGAAKALLGNVYIVQKNWEAAETILKSMQDYALLNDYAAVFDPANKNNSESVFEIQFKQGTEGMASNFFYTFLVQPISAAEITVVTGIAEVARTIEGYNIPTPDIINAYEPGDLREDASVAYITAGGQSYPYIKKYAHAHQLNNNTDDNWPVYRYAEVLLFIAEALNEQNDAEALTYLNMVHAHSRTGLSPLNISGQATIREAILQERRVELAFENKRWLDLVRAGKADEVMTAYGESLKADPQAYYFPAGITVPPAAYTNINLKFPIPASEVALNPYF